MVYAPKLVSAELIAKCVTDLVDQILVMPQSDSINSGD